MKTFEYRLRPNKTQEAALMTVLVGTRHVYNDGLQELIEHYKRTGTYLSRFAHDKLHNKARHPALPAVVVDTTLDRLHRAFANFFRGRKEGRRIGFPRFKAGNRWHTIQFRDASNVLKGRYFKAGKLCGGNIRTVVHRPFEGTFKFARVVKRPSGWYLQCVCATLSQPLPVRDNAVGLDMGVTFLVADSDGGFIPNPKHFRTSAARLAKAQRARARCQKGSQRGWKAGQRIARLHEKIANRRKDTLHKVSRHYVNTYQLIAIEDLHPVNMIRNHALALSITDASWGRLRQMLIYKAAEAGRALRVIAPHYTSQRCSQCAQIVQKSLAVRTHFCPFCGFLADRDMNAARNILLQARTGPSLSVGEGHNHV
jgi:putative transposase